MDPRKVAVELPSISHLDETIQKIYWTALYEFCVRCDVDTTHYGAVRLFTELAKILKEHTSPTPLHTTLVNLYPVFEIDYSSLPIKWPEGAEIVTHGLNKHYPRLLSLPLTVPIPETPRFEGTFMVARSGSGKTTLIENMVAHDIAKVVEKKASLLVMDGQGKNELLGRLADTYPHVLLDTTTPLNIFAMPRMPNSPREAEILRTNASSLVTDVFSVRLGGMPFTPKQKVPFNFCVQLIMEAGGTIADMYKLLLPKGLEHYRQHLPKLSPPARLFFETQFDDPKQYIDTKKEIIIRLDGVMSVPAFARMFTSKKSLDLHSLLQKPGLVLVDTDTALLGRDGTAIFGRFIINMLVLSGIQRLELPAQQRLDSYVYVDEAADYIGDDPNIEYIVDKFRKARIATFWAVQREKNIVNPAVLDALQHCAVQIRQSEKKFHFTYQEERNAPVVVTSPPVSRPRYIPPKGKTDIVVLDGEIIPPDPPKKAPELPRLSGPTWGEDDIDITPR
jgi:hypothetical protein